MIRTASADKSLFFGEHSNEPMSFFDDAVKEGHPNEGFWKILVVDDEQDVHEVTNLVLRSMTFKNRRLKLFDCYSAAEARDMLVRHPDTALILLDVVMETDDAGLRLVKKIREEMGMTLVQIVLRTGQPGYAPEAEVVQKYEINDYQTKTDLTKNRLITVVTSSLRSFDSLTTIADMRNDLENTVQERTKELEESNTLKDKMFAIIAHDLRGPVGNLKSILDLLVHTENLSDSKNVADYLQILQTNAGATLSLLDNLLFWARSQLDLLDPQLFSADLNPVIKDVVALLAENARRKNIALAFECTTPNVVMIDENMVSLIIRNLVSNAIKFTETDGTVIIATKDVGDKVEISVSDSGTGMGSDLLKSLFDPKMHVSNYGTNYERGSGLGLLLCNEFAARHGSTIVVESTPGKGSTFRFQLKKS